MADKKTFSTHNQQLRVLRGRGLEVPTNGTPKRVLEKKNYYNLINGYKDLFLDHSSSRITGNDVYRIKSNFFEIHALYKFDNELKMVFLRRLLRIEDTLKSEISYVFSEKYGHDNYLKADNFDLLPRTHPKYRERFEAIIHLITRIQNDIAAHLRHPSIRHYLVKHGYIPLWVLVNILTFGRMNFFYQYMKSSERNRVARIYSIRDKEMVTLVKILSQCRNQCAHDEKLFDFWSKAEIPDKSYHTNLGITRRGRRFIMGKNDLFAVLIAIKVLSGEKEFNTMVTQIRNQITMLGKQLTSISLNDVLNKMGFPPNWENLKNL